MSRIRNIDRTVKPAFFHPAALEALRTFPEDVRRAIGKAIFELQEGHRPGMPLSRAMPSIAAGVSELRVRGKDGSYRAFYSLRTAHSVVIFHAFMKKTQKTPQREISIAQQRLKEIDP
jgi:phage-related protein